MEKVEDFYFRGEDGTNYIISIYCDAEYYEKLHAILESKRISIGRGYSVEKHSPHTSENQYHLHLYRKQNQLLAINKDGTAHDQSHGLEIPKYPLGYLRKNFPEFDIPENGIIESYIPGPMESLDILLG